MYLNDNLQKEKSSSNKERFEMNIQPSEYEVFLTKLRELSFHTVSFVMAKRSDLHSFISKSGNLTTSEDPWFGHEWALLTEEGKKHADIRYHYYFGFADDIYFAKDTRKNSKICFIPINSLSISKHNPPKVGELLIGQTEDVVENDQLKKRFIWWNRASKQDHVFTKILLGQASYSDIKLEKKLTVIDDANGNSNRTLLLLVKALYYNDTEYFVDIMKKGQLSQGFDNGYSIDKWLKRHVKDLKPEFWEKFKIRARDAGLESYVLS